ncbi:hypothetical protein CEXT_788841 [Caerostris extrusa]|uniref:Uncharacterized protein n=1 Tax=Caerostris extrusa TaxID=172846 RepID=A0AAV4WW18_CAEEX|nr:hypothetical protein CEXT_788841 [Caerostris extrusa]
MEIFPVPRYCRAALQDLVLFAPGQLDRGWGALKAGLMAGECPGIKKIPLCSLPLAARSRCYPQLQDIKTSSFEFSIYADIHTKIKLLSKEFAILILNKGQRGQAIQVRVPKHGFISPKTAQACFRARKSPLIQTTGTRFVFIIPRKGAESVQNLTNRDSSRCALLTRPEKKPLPTPSTMKWPHPNSETLRR